jgi:hypothetical protein
MAYTFVILLLGFVYLVKLACYVRNTGRVIRGSDVILAEPEREGKAWEVRNTLFLGMFHEALGNRMRAPWRSPRRLHG